MSVVRWDPFTVLARLDGDFDELVRRAWGGPATARSGRTVPCVGDAGAYTVTCKTTKGIPSASRFVPQAI